MDNFRTRVKIPEFPFSIDHRNAVMCIGSCFAEHMFSKLAAFKFHAFLNPYGILYNPIVIGASLSAMMDKAAALSHELVFNNGLWHSFDHHGRFSNPDKEQGKKNMAQAFVAGRDFLKSTNRLLVTLGTAHVYEYIPTGKIVANCHKFPAADFNKRLLSVDSIIQALEGSFNKLKYSNPELEILLTVSPVRHLRDGLAENQRSKATLILAVEQLTRQYDFIHYFPAYEIVLDELRDYRFFENDMAHPNNLAIDYIWSCFSEALFSTDTQALIKRIGKVIQAATHKPFFPETSEHQFFLKKQLEKISQLQNEFSFLDFEKETTIFRKNLVN